MSSNSVHEQYHYLDQHGRLTKDAEVALSEPFAAEDVKWRPQPTGKGKAIALPYADPRAYHERLDDVFGPANWSSTLLFTPAPYHIMTEERKNNDGTIWKPAVDFSGHKLFAIASITIAGLGTKTSAGECETDNENAATVSEAQAFKRACSMLGIGRYFYAMQQQELSFERGKGFTPKPTLPDWAMPKTKCQNCSKVITDFTYKDKEKKDVVMPTAEVIELSKTHFGGAIMCGPCVALKRSELQATQKKASQPAAAATQATQKEQVA
jgi:hypothetical protein